MSCENGTMSHISGLYGFVITYGEKSRSAKAPNSAEFEDLRNFRAIGRFCPPPPGADRVKVSWIKRYATDRLDDHWADIIDRELKISRGRRRQILTWGTEALTCMINKKYPCIESFFKAWIDFKTSFHFRPAKTHNNLLHSPIFFNPWILRNPTAKDLANYGEAKSEKECLKPSNLDYQTMNAVTRKLSTCLMRTGSNQSMC